jgi:hypothetical protein
LTVLLVTSPIMLVCGALIAFNGFVGQGTFVGVCGCVLAACGVLLLVTTLRTRAALARTIKG